MWALRGLRNGVLTTRWPARPDDYAAGTRGPGHRAGRGPQPARHGDAGLGRLCPAGAISQDGRARCGSIRAAASSAAGAWPPGRTCSAGSGGPASAALSRGGAGRRRAATRHPKTLAALRRELQARTAALRRSVHLRHVDAGSDGTEEWEILALLNPVYDIHRLGMFFTASPRHADVLLVTGAGARGMAEPLRQTYEAMPDPKVVIAVGTDAVSGGLAGPSYATAGGIGGVVPVDVWLPGSPPSPFSILYALLLALGRLPGSRCPAGTLPGRTVTSDDGVLGGAPGRPGAARRWRRPPTWPAGVRRPRLRAACPTCRRGRVGVPGRGRGGGAGRRRRDAVRAGRAARARAPPGLAADRLSGLFLLIAFGAARARFAGPR